MRRLRRVRIKKYPTLPRAQAMGQFNDPKYIPTTDDIASGLSYNSQNNPAVNTGTIGDGQNAFYNFGRGTGTEQDLRDMMMLGNYGKGMSTPPEEESTQLKIYQDSTPEKGREINYGKLANQVDAGINLFTGLVERGKSDVAADASMMRATDLYRQQKIQSGDTTAAKSATGYDTNTGFQAAFNTGFEGQKPLMGRAQRGGQLKRVRIKRYPGGLPNPGYVGEVFPILQSGGLPVFQTTGAKQEPTFDKDGNEYVTVTGYYGGAENPAAADVEGDASTYYGGIEKKPVTKRILRSDYDKMVKATADYKKQQQILRDKKYGKSNKSFDERGYGDVSTNQDYKGALSVSRAEKLNPEYYPSEKIMFDLNKQIMGIDPIDLRGKQGAKKYSIEKNPFGIRQSQLDFKLDVEYGDCPPCKDGTKPKRDKDNNCLPCDDKPAKKVTCPECADGKPGVYNEEKKECECPKEQRQEQQAAAAPPKPDAPYWLQDTIKMGAAFGDLMSVKKYLPYAPKVDLETPTPTFVDPTRELAKQSETANIAAQATAAFAGPQQTSARMSGIQGTAAGQAADTLSRVNQQNVGIANQFGQQAASIANQESLANQKISSKLFDQTTIANQQYDNAKRAARSNLVNTFTGAITNRWQADAMNQMYPDYNIDVSVGGAFTPNIQQKNTQLSTPTKTAEERLSELKSKGLSTEDIKIIMDREAKNPPQQQAAGASGLLNVFQTQNRQYGGETSYPFDTYNSTQYGNGIANPEGAKGKPSFKTTNSLYPVPRDEANLEAEGGETVFGDINGDGFPESNVIRGKRHSEGGVPLNLPDETFIFSDFKEMKIKDPELLKMFGKDRSKKSKSKKGYTPAQLAKQYDINKYRQILQDPDEDKLAKRTAEIMIENYNKKLGALSLAQEAQKGFPQGIPAVARPYMESNGISDEAVLPQAEMTNNMNQQQIFDEAAQG